MLKWFCYIDGNLLVFLSFRKKLYNDYIYIKLTHFGYQKQNIIETEFLPWLLKCFKNNCR